MGTDFSYEEYMPYKSAGRKVLIPYLLKKAGIPYSDAVYQKYYDMREKNYYAGAGRRFPQRT